MTLSNGGAGYPGRRTVKNRLSRFCKSIVEEAIKAERDRLKDIDSIANGIPNDVLMKAKYEEPLSAAIWPLCNVTRKTTRPDRKH